MAVAKCTQCDERVAYRQPRGSRLRDMRCPKCGGEMTKARYSWAAHDNFNKVNKHLFPNGIYKGDIQEYYKAVYL